MEVAKLTCMQYSNKEIGCLLGTSVRTVEAFKKNIMRKTGARNNVGIAMYAVKFHHYTAVVLYIVICLLPDDCLEAASTFLF